MFKWLYIDNLWQFLVYSSIILHCYLLLSLYRTSWLWTLYGSWSHYTTHLWQGLWCMGCWCNVACVIIRPITLFRIWQKTTRIYRQRTCDGGLLIFKTFIFLVNIKRYLSGRVCFSLFFKGKFNFLERVLTVKQFTLNECS